MTNKLGPYGFMGCGSLGNVVQDISLPKNKMDMFHDQNNSLFK